MLLLQHSIQRDVLALAFAPEGRTLLAGVNGGFEVWDLDSNQHDLVRTSGRDKFWAFEFDPLGRWIYVSDSEGARFFPPPYRDFRRLPGLGSDNHVISLAVAWDGSGVAVSRGTVAHNRVECWTVAPAGGMSLAWSRPASPNSRPGRLEDMLHSPMFSGLAFHPARTCLTALHRAFGRSCPILLLDANTGEDLASFGTIEDTREAWFSFTPDGRHLLVGEPLEIALWDIATRQRVASAPRYGSSKFSGVAVHPSGRFFATSAGDRCVRLWSLPECKPCGVLKWDIGKLHSIALSRDGMLGAAGGQKGQIVVWDVEADM